jgi:hypothetical protein
MTRVVWDDLGKRLYHTGVDRGMLYISDAIPVAVPWNGLVSVTESPGGGIGQPYYIDGQKVLNVPSGEDFSATIESYAAPLEFAPCAGRIQLSTGLFSADQPKKPFGFSYRTRIGNDTGGVSFAYKIHIVYNALAKIADFTHGTDTATPTTSTHSWDISTVPVSVTGYKPMAHFVVDSRLVTSAALSAIENVLYGTDTSSPRIPDPAELIGIIGYYKNLIRVIDNFNGNVVSTSTWFVYSGSSPYLTEANGVLSMRENNSAYTKLETHADDFDLSTGVLAAKLSQSGSGPSGTHFAFVVKSSGNYIYIQLNRLAVNWSFNLYGAVTVTPIGLPADGTQWVDGDWLGLGNLGSDNILHVYKSSDNGGSWTDIGSATIGGTFNKAAVGVMMEVGQAISTYTALIDEVSAFSVGG